jgi:cyclin-dependent kinase 2
VGKGAYGVVCRAVDLRNNETVALKRVTIDTMNEGLPSTSIREISLLREIDHKNVVRYVLNDYV